MSTYLLPLRSANMLPSSSRFVCLGTAVPEALANLTPPSNDFPADGSFRSMTRNEDCSGAATSAFWKSSAVAVDFRLLNATPNLGIKKIVQEIRILIFTTPYNFRYGKYSNRRLQSCTETLGKENNMRIKGPDVR